MKRTYALLLLLLFTLPLFGQGEAAVWYFGNNAGLNFNTEPPTALTDGALSTLEGCATISDSSGNLLFYTNGTNVWNRDHQLMPNGTGLLGEDTSTQSAIIVPNPDDLFIYYIFTVDGLFPGENNPANLRGLNFSAVDMSLDGGLGDIVIAEKNINLLPTNSEKITAVRNADCESIWVITHFVDRFYAYDVTAAGVNLIPVESVVDPVVPLIGYRDNALGYLKSSPDGTKLAIAHTTLNENPASDAESPGKFLVYNFDTATGMVTGGLDLNVNEGSPYGVEFSPDSNLVYACVGIFNETGFDHGEVYQYDLTATDPSAALTLLTSNDTSTGAMQLGIDGRIYRVIVGQNSLDVIENPNVAGVGANYQIAAVSLGGRTGNFGLPPFISSLFLDTIDIIQNGESTIILNLCEGEDYLLVAPDIPGATYEWSLDGVVLADSDLDLLVSTSGMYRVEVDPMNGDCPLIGRANVVLSSLPIAFDATLIQCDFDDANDGITRFNLTQAIDDITGGDTSYSVSFHLSFIHAQNNSLPLDATAYTNVSNPQVIFARVSNQNGCVTITTLELIVSASSANEAYLSSCDDITEDGFTLFNLDDALPQILDGLPAGLVVSYYKTVNDALDEVAPLASAFTNTIAYNQIIYGRIESGNDCYGISEILLEVFTLPNIESDISLIYCLNSFPDTIRLDVGEIIDPDSPIESYSFLWSTGEITPFIDVNAIGVYSVQITNPEGCSKTRRYTVAPSEPAIIGEITVTDLVQDNAITITFSGTGDYEFALNNILGPYQESPIFENVPAGIHIAYVRDKNGCGISEQIVSVLGFPRYFSPNSDGIHDYWQVLGVRQDFARMTQIFIYDRFGKTLAALDPLGIGWDGQYRGNPMPSSDYWFLAIFEDGRTFRSHFSLIR